MNRLTLFGIASLVAYGALLAAKWGAPGPADTAYPVAASGATSAAQELMRRNASRCDRFLFAGRHPDESKKKRGCISATP